MRMEGRLGRNQTVDQSLCWKTSSVYRQNSQSFPHLILGQSEFNYQVLNWHQNSQRKNGWDKRNTWGVFVGMQALISYVIIENMSM